MRSSARRRFRRSSRIAVAVTAYITRGAPLDQFGDLCTARDRAEVPLRVRPGDRRGGKASSWNPTSALVGRTPGWPGIGIPFLQDGGGHQPSVSRFACASWSYVEPQGTHPGLGPPSARRRCRRTAPPPIGPPPQARRCRVAFRVALVSDPHLRAPGRPGDLLRERGRMHCSPMLERFYICPSRVHGRPSAVQSGARLEPWRFFS
jgi:hypothetical protein